jgi:GNAT superfamily N-acetyltransferase
VSGLLVREATVDDRPAVLALLAATLGWLPDDHHAAFFEWKHGANPFGPSFAWVAIDEASGDLAGFRTFLRWRFEGGVQAVRAVDTATAPAHQGKGVFSRLTRHGLDEVRDAGVDCVFNTPNDQSRPGYLKMGWQQVGRVPVVVRAGGPVAVARVARARTAADLWSQPTDAGEPAGDALADSAAVTRLLDAVGEASPGVVRTERSPELLRWRYAGFAPLGYRALRLGRDLADGLALFRVRRRGAATEAMVGDLLVPGGDRRVAGRLLAGVRRATGADYAIATAATGRGVPVPRQGPILTWRAVGDGPDSAPPLDRWSLALGDIELF